MRLFAGKHGASNTPTPMRVSTSPASPDDAHQPGERRPERQARAVGEARAEAVEEDAARNLQQRVAPRERGEHEAHRRRGEAQILREVRRGDAEHGAIEVVQHDTADIYSNGVSEEILGRAIADFARARRSGHCDEGVSRVGQRAATGRAVASADHPRHR